MPTLPQEFGALPDAPERTESVQQDRGTNRMARSALLERAAILARQGLGERGLVRALLALDRGGLRREVDLGALDALDLRQQALHRRGTVGRSRHSGDGQGHGLGAVAGTRGLLDARFLRASCREDDERGTGENVSKHVASPVLGLKTEETGGSGGPETHDRPISIGIRIPTF